MAPQVGLEPTTLRLTGQFRSPRHTKTNNQVQQNTRNPPLLVAPFWLVLLPGHGQKADRGHISSRPHQGAMFAKLFCVTRLISFSSNRPGNVPLIERLFHVLVPISTIRAIESHISKTARCSPPASLVARIFRHDLVEKLFRGHAAPILKPSRHFVADLQRTTSPT